MRTLATGHLWLDSLHRDSHVSLQNLPIIADSLVSNDTEPTKPSVRVNRRYLSRRLGKAITIRHATPYRKASVA